MSDARCQVVYLVAITDTHQVPEAVDGCIDEEWRMEPTMVVALPQYLHGSQAGGARAKKMLLKIHTEPECA